MKWEWMDEIVGRKWKYEGGARVEVGVFQGEGGGEG